MKRTLAARGKFMLIIWPFDLSELSMSGVRRPIPPPLGSGALVKTCIACLYSNQTVDKTAVMLRFTNRLIFVLATGLH